LVENDRKSVESCYLLHLLLEFNTRVLTTKMTQQTYRCNAVRNDNN